MNAPFRRTVFAVLAVLTAAALGAALWVGAERARWERDYRQVALAAPAPALLDALAAGEDPAALRALAPYAVLDAASLEALAPFRLQPLEALAGPGDDARVPRALGAGELDQLHGLGFQLVLALPSLPLLDAPRLAVLDGLAARRAPAGVLFVETLAGWTPESLAAARDAFGAAGAWTGVLEFFEPPGLPSLFGGAGDRWVRAHAIPVRERAALDRDAALDRYARAALERSIRLFIVQAAGAQTLRDNLEALARRLAGAGFTRGEVPALPPWAVPAWTAWALSLAVWTGTVWLFEPLWRARPWTLWAVAGLAALIVAWQFGHGDEGVRFLALSVAILVPLCVYRAIVQLPQGRGAGRAAGVFALGSLATVLGGLVEAGLLSQPAYFLKLAAFDGVKLALIEPVLVIAYWELKRRGPGVWRRLWRRPLTWGDALLGAAALGALVVVVARSGNDSFLPALPFEESLRGQLETWLVARPRFKEFLLGHPAQFVWLAWGVHRWGDLGVPVALVGFLGQTTILNSFAHLHTPLVFTLWRTANGLALGLLAGLLAWALLRWGVRRWRPASS